MAHDDFIFSDSAEPHKLRTREIIRKHPEIRELVGRNPWSFAIIVGIVSLQLALTFALSDQSWWLVVLTAYLIGAFANHALFVMVHECSHNLVFKKRSANFWAAILCDIPNLIPSAISFRRYHLKHHSFQGVYELDADLASRWEARLIGNSTIGKAIWLLLFPIFQALRPPRLKEIKFNNIWTWINMVFVFSIDVLIYIYMGPQSFFYLALSFFFSIGLHPLGARWIQEHYIVNPPQETYSYYGPLNTLAFNVGYHNEHHDFSSIPWNRLPKIRKYAPEYYNTLVYHTSWFKLLMKFLFDKKLSLFSRVSREERANVTLNTNT